MRSTVVPRLDHNAGPYAAGHRDTSTTLIEDCAAWRPIGAATDLHAGPAIIDGPRRLIRSSRLRAASPPRDTKRAPRALR